MIRNIIFDWSGTLVDDLPAVLQAANHVFTKLGQDPWSLDRFRAEFSLPFKDFYDRFVPRVDIRQMEQWFHQRFEEVQDEVSPLPHAREFLQACRDRGVKTFLLSAVHPPHWRNQADSSGFAPFIQHPYLGVMDKRLKIHELLQEHGLAPEETLFIGDMQHDIETARHGGVFSCAVLTGYNRLEQLRASRPDLIVEHLGELLQMLNGQGWEIRPSAPAPRMPIATVGAAIFNQAGEVLMIRTRKWSHLWGIPGGKIKYGESSIEALRREIMEETNLDIDEIRFVLVQDCIHSREFYREAHFILLNYVCRAREGREVALNDEAQEFRWVSRSDALQFALNEPTRRLLLALPEEPWTK